MSGLPFSRKKQVTLEAKPEGFVMIQIQPDEAMSPPYRIEIRPSGRRRWEFLKTTWMTELRWPPTHIGVLWEVRVTAWRHTETLSVQT